MDQSELTRQIEALFGEATPQNVRDVSRRLERLVRQIADPRTRARYEGAIDHLPEMVAHLDEGR